MWLKTLTTEGFRDLRDPTLEFDPRANYFFGRNATGKTSLLEAIHYLSVGRSFRAAQEKDMIRFGATLLAVRGAAFAGEDPATRTGEIRADGQAKRLLLDGVEVDRLSSYLGWLPVVTMLLDDIRLIRGSPAERRGFLDLAFSKVARAYLLAYAEYRRVLTQRNRALVQTHDDNVLRTWESQLATAGAAVYEQRYQYLPGLLEAAGQLAAGLFEEKPVEFGYRATVSRDGDVAANLRSAFERLRARERELGVTLSGPHRDDIVIKLGERDLRRFGSEGEQRSASIVLKLAEARMLHLRRREAPVFLLDEIASELDPERSRKLFTLLEAEGQIFYAAAKPIAAQGKVFHVEAGEAQAA